MTLSEFQVKVDDVVKFLSRVDRKFVKARKCIAKEDDLSIPLRELEQLAKEIDGKIDIVGEWDSPKGAANVHGALLKAMILYGITIEQWTAVIHAIQEKSKSAEITAHSLGLLTSINTRETIGDFHELYKEVWPKKLSSKVKDEAASTRE